MSSSTDPDPDPDPDFRLPEVETTDHVETDEHLVLRPEYSDDTFEEIIGPPTEPPPAGDDARPVWVKLPSAPRPTSDVLWHYTDAGGAIGILRDNELWATALTSLNDTEEFAFAQPVLKRLLTKALGSQHLTPEQKTFIENCVDLAIASSNYNPLYVCCASEHQDSLAQWRAYGESGYAIGVANTSDVYGVVVDAPERRRRLAHRGPWPSWSKVLYDEPGQAELLAQGLSFCAQITPDPRREELVPGMTAHQGGAVLAGLLCHCKHPAFEVEREVRMVAISALNSNAVRHRPSKYGVAPYVRLAVPPDRAVGEPAWWTVTDHPQLPVRKVLVGPGPANESARIGMRSLLVRTGHVAEVKLSNAPYR